MRLIDEKARLFGKINVIDFLVILFLVCLVPMFYFGYKIMTKKPVVSEGTIELETNCRFTRLKPEVLKLISVGDKQVDENAQVIGEIISLGEIVPFKYEFEIGGMGTEEKIIREVSHLKQLEAKLKLITEIKGNKLYYKDRIVKFGSPLEFTTNKYSVTILPIRLRKKREEEVTLKVKFRNVLPEIAAIVKPGDEQVEVSEQMHGSKRIMAKVRRIISNKPAEVVSLSAGQATWKIIGHPDYRDLVLELDILCEQRGNELFFTQYKLPKIGLPFNFSADLYLISGIVIGMERK